MKSLPCAIFISAQILSGSWASGAAVTTPAPARFFIRVQFSQPHAVDSLYLLMQNTFFASQEQQGRIGAKAGADGSFVFQVHSTHESGTFQIRQKLRDNAGSAAFSAVSPLITTQRWKAGDQVTITVSRKHQGAAVGDPDYDYGFEFSGTGSAKYTVTHQIALAYRLPRDCDGQELLEQSSSFYKDPASLKMQAALRQLEGVKAGIADSDYQLIKADLLGKGAVSRFRKLQEQWSRLDQGQGSLAWKSWPVRYDLDSVIATIDPALVERSAALVRLLAGKLVFESSIKGRGFKECIDLIESDYQGPLKDKLLLNVLTWREADDQIDAIFDKVDALVSAAECRRELDRLAASLPGITARNFQLQEARGSLVNLSDFIGKVVVLDTWFTGCGGCLNYFRQVLKPAEEQLAGEDQVVFLTLSIDKAKDSWLKSVASGKYVGRHSVNVFTNGKGSEHPWIRFYQVASFPTVMILDEKGRIFRIYRSPSHPDINTPEALRRTLDQARHP